MLQLKMITYCKPLQNSRKILTRKVHHYLLLLLSEDILYAKNQKNVTTYNSLCTLYQHIRVDVVHTQRTHTHAHCDIALCTYHYSMYTLSWILKSINNSWMQLHMILKFGSFVVLLDPLRPFQNLFVLQSIKIFTIHFLWGSHNSTVSISILSQTCSGAKPYMSAVDTFAVIYH